MSRESMSVKLARVVELRAWRERQAQRALCEQRDALLAAEQQAERERQALQAIEDSARQAREQLCSTAIAQRADEAHVHLAYAARRRHQARSAALTVRRAEADVVQAHASVDAARQAWQQRARAHTTMSHQHDTLAHDESARATRRSEEASADEHLEGWIARRAGFIGGRA
jgi:hypothetical protein